MSLQIGAFWIGENILNKQSDTALNPLFFEMALR